jgi:hypothetical protein
MNAGQLDLSLRVAVCAWCKPRVALGEIGSLSHGICPRHLRKFKLEAQGIMPMRRRRGPARSAQDESTREALLPL